MKIAKTEHVDFYFWSVSNFLLEFVQTKFWKGEEILQWKLKIYP